jgi:hypothetical protein
VFGVWSIEPAAGGAKGVEQFIDAFPLVPQPDGIDRRIGDQVDTHVEVLDVNRQTSTGGPGRSHECGAVLDKYLSSIPSMDSTVTVFVI